MKLKTVISLFDGMSCGRLALDRAGIEYDNYYASEVDKHAIKVAIHNYPDTVELGDINNWKEWPVDWSQVDLILAGSPCQGFSFAGKQLAFDDPRSRLFFVFVDILNYVKSLNSKVKFLLENVVMKKQFQEIITQQVRVEPVLINSALVSAQNRKRLYWANWHFEQPQDKGILLKDITEDGLQSFGLAQRGRYDENAKVIQKYELNGTEKNNAMTTVSKDTLIFIPADKHSILAGMASDIKGHDVLRRIYSIDGKCPTLTAICGGNQEKKIAISENQYRKLTPVECERLQTVPDNYTAPVSNTQRYRMLGNGWTVDVIAHILSSIDAGEQNIKQMRLNYA